MEEKFNFSELIKNIEEYLLTIELNQNEMLQVNRILYKLRNIDAITSTIDEFSNHLKSFQSLIFNI